MRPTPTRPRRPRRRSDPASCHRSTRRFRRSKASRPRVRYSIPLPDGRTLDLGERTLVMAVVNVTPDSFADGGDRFDPDTAVADAIRFVADGADLIDIGGESTRPGADPLPAADELRRVTPVLEGLRGRVDVPVSIDTYKAEVAERALDLGATIVNDVSGLVFDPSLAEVIARRRAGVVLMHTRGRSREMYAEAAYQDVIGEVTTELAARVEAAEVAGIARERVIVDPGLGFAKRPHHTFLALSGLASLGVLDRPILVGPSRKSFLTEALGERPPADRVWGTAAAVTAAVLFGAHIVRVHDVKPMADVVRVADALRHAPSTPSE